MRVEVLHEMSPEGESRVRGAVLIAEGEKESAVLDQVFGSQVGDCGLIGSRRCECRLADGCGEHYVYVNAAVDLE